MELLTTLSFTKHADERMAQRAIADWKLELVIRFGKSRRHKNANVHFLSEKDIQKMLDLGVIGPQDPDKLRNLFVIENDARIVTAYFAGKKKQQKMKRIGKGFYF